MILRLLQVVPRVFKYLVPLSEFGFFVLDEHARLYGYYYVFSMLFLILIELFTMRLIEPQCMC